MQVVVVIPEDFVGQVSALARSLVHDTHPAPGLGAVAINLDLVVTEQVLTRTTPTEVSTSQLDNRVHALPCGRVGTRIGGEDLVESIPDALVTQERMKIQDGDDLRNVC